jgi:hypothetical protein
MSVLEPVARGDASSGPVVPEQRESDAETAAAPVPTDAPVVDHVRSHSNRCYWDFVECRWACVRG